MKAVIYTEYGPPDVLQLRDIETPMPKDHEIRVKVVATTVTAGDRRLRSLTFPRWFRPVARVMFGLTKPRKHILGAELSGVVDAVGTNVTRFEVGDPVFGSTGYRFGAYAEYTCLPEKGLVALKPPNVSHEEAAAVPFAGLAAMHFLGKGRIRKGHEVMIYGASGGVGTLAVPIAKHLGAKVTGVCGASSFALVESLGADEVVDYEDDAYTKGNETYDVIFDAVGKTSFAKCKHMLRPGGVFVTVGVDPTLMVLTVWTSLFGDKKVVSGVATETLENLAFLQKLMDAGELRPVIDRVYPFDDVAEAHRYVDRGHKRGNVVITVDPATARGAEHSESRAAPKS